MFQETIEIFLSSEETELQDMITPRTGALSSKKCIICSLRLFLFTPLSGGAESSKSTPQPPFWKISFEKWAGLEVTSK